MKLFNTMVKLAATGAFIAAAGSALAEDFPDRRLSIVVPFNPGGSTDAIARQLAEGMSKDLGQPVIVENRPGANAATGALAVLNAKHDGYSMFFGTDSALVLNGLLHSKLEYDPANDFTAVGLVASVPIGMFVSTQMPVTTPAEFVDYAQSGDKQVNYGSTGIGGVYHLTAEAFSEASGVTMEHIPYTGGAPALQALLGGEVDVLFSVVGSTLPYVDSGQLRPLAVVTPKRLDVLPDTPTLAEVGFPGMQNMVRYGLVVPFDVPAERVTRLNDALNAAIQQPQFLDMIANGGFIPPEPHAPTEFDKILSDSRESWSALIQARGISIE